jgi:hypothetical protein
LEGEVDHSGTFEGALGHVHSDVLTVAVVRLVQEETSAGEFRRRKTACFLRPEPGEDVEDFGQIDVGSVLGEAADSVACSVFESGEGAEHSGSPLMVAASCFIHAMQARRSACSDDERRSGS